MGDLRIPRPAVPLLSHSTASRALRSTSLPTHERLNAPLIRSPFPMPRHQALLHLLRTMHDARLFGTHERLRRPCAAGRAWPCAAPADMPTHQQAIYLPVREESGPAADACILEAAPGIASAAQLVGASCVRVRYAGVLEALRNDVGGVVAVR